MKIIYSEKHRKHEPPFEIFDGGLRMPYLENPDRMDRILNALGDVDWADVLEPSDFGLDPILAVHDRDYLDFLASAWGADVQMSATRTAESLNPSALIPFACPSVNIKDSARRKNNRQGWTTLD